MTPHQFTAKLSRSYKPYDTQEQEQDVTRLVRKFSDDQLDQLYDHVIVSSRFRPNVADIYKVAEELGFLVKEIRERPRNHSWVKTDCDLCAGEGRIAVYFSDYHVVNNETGNVDWRRQLDKIFAYSDFESISAWSKPPATRCFLFRCSCDQGDVDTIPKGWPKWRRGR